MLMCLFKNRKKPLQYLSIFYLPVLALIKAFKYISMHFCVSVESTAP